MFKNDFNRTVIELEPYDWYRMQPLNVKYALINMNFNLGIKKLLTFHRMIAALEERNYTSAATEALDSLWATQVHQRANDIAVMMRENK